MQALVRLWLHAYDCPKCTVGKGSRIQRLLLFFFFSPVHPALWKIFISLWSVSLKLHSWCAFSVFPRESCWIWIHSSMKRCVTAIISEMKWVARWQWFRKVKSLHSPVCFCYGVTTAHVNIWNTFNCCKQRCSLDTGSCYWEAVLTVPEGILELKPLQMRVRKEITTLC